MIPPTCPRRYVEPLAQDATASGYIGGEEGVVKEDVGRARDARAQRTQSPFGHGRQRDAPEPSSHIVFMLTSAMRSPVTTEKAQTPQMATLDATKPDSREALLSFERPVAVGRPR